MKQNQILEDAKFNTEQPNQEHTRWTKLESFGDLEALREQLSPDHIALIDDPRERQLLAIEIEGGVTFAFWFNDDNKLCFDR